VIVTRRHRSYAALREAAREAAIDDKEDLAVKAVVRDLVRALGAKSLVDLSPQQAMYVEHAAFLRVVTAATAARAIKDGIVNQRGRMNRLLSKNWLTWHNTLARCLHALEFTKRKGTGPKHADVDIGKLLAQSKGNDTTTAEGEHEEE